MRALFAFLFLMAFAPNGFAQFSEPPIATNTINAIQLRELNLRSGDYTIMQSVTATSIIAVEHSKKGFTITCEDENFMLKYKYLDKDREEKYAILDDWEGVVKLGFLNNMVDWKLPKNAADVAKRLAIYRLINTAQQAGADGVIEPIVSMNMARSGKLYYYKTTVTGRLIKLNAK